MSTCAYCRLDLLADVANSGDLGLAACAGCLNINVVVWSNGTPHTRALAGVDSIDHFAPNGSVMHGVLRSARDAIDRLPVLAEVPRRVVALAHDPIASVRDLAGVVDDDAGLSLRVLKQANSAANAPASKITDIAHACSHLGMKSILRIAQTELNAGAFRKAPEAIRTQSETLWRHGVVTAYCADRLAYAAKLREPETMFLAGLVHDIGKLVLLDAILNVHRGRMGRLAEDSTLLDGALTRFAPWVGALVVQFWKMPDEILCAAFFSAQPDRVPHAAWQPSARVIGLASTMAAHLGFDLGAAPRAGSCLAEHPSVPALGLSNVHMAAIQEEMSQFVSEFGGLFDLS